MESQKPKVAMYVKRSFGDKLNASFDFIKENWKILLKFTTYLLLPVSLIQALSLNGLMRSVCQDCYVQDCDGAGYCIFIGIYVLLRSVYDCIYDRQYFADLHDLCIDPYL